MAIRIPKVKKDTLQVPKKAGKIKPLICGYTGVTLFTGTESECQRWQRKEVKSGRWARRVQAHTQGIIK